MLESNKDTCLKGTLKLVILICVFEVILGSYEQDVVDSCEDGEVVCALTDPFTGECINLSCPNVDVNRRGLAFDRTGEMPGLDKPLGPEWRSDLCKLKPTKLLPRNKTVELAHFEQKASKDKQAASNSGNKLTSVEKKRFTLHQRANRNSLSSIVRQRRTLLKNKKRGRRHKSKKHDDRPSKSIHTQRPPGWTLGHPSEADRAYIAKAVQAAPTYCPYLIKECAHKDRAYYFKMMFSEEKCCHKRRACCENYVGFGNNYTVPYVWDELPSIKKGSWGSCALIGLSDNLLRNARGKDIDSHDVVIRYGHQPVQGYADFVGTRTDVVIARSAMHRMDPSFVGKDIKLYIYYSPSGEIPYLRLMSCDNSDDSGCPRSASRNLASYIYQSMTAPIGKKGRAPTSGFAESLRLIFSGYCQRVDLYGFSKDGGGEYYNRGNIMKLHHSSEVESWLFHYLMRYHTDLGVCVYL